MTPDEREGTNVPPDRAGGPGRGRTRDDPLERLRQFERERGYDDPDEEKDDSHVEECDQEPSEDEPQL
jgi:hypothetical protein